MMPFNFRYLEPENDLPKLARLYAVAQAADDELQEAGDERMREHMAYSGRGPIQDCWVVESSDAPNEIIAVAGVRVPSGSDQAQITGVVHPTWRRKGIGRILISRVKGRARGMNVGQAGATAEAQTQSGNIFLKDHGFLPVSAFTRFEAPGNHDFAAPRWPAGFTVKSFDAVLDVSVLAHAITDSYDGLWGHKPMKEAEVGAMLRDWEPNGIFLVFDAGGEVAGMCRSKIDSALSQQRGSLTGYIDAPGVLPWRRRQELYLPLLLTAARYLQARQPKRIELESWGDDDRTMDVFREAGFAVVRQTIAYRLNLR
jgi:ribosomal protein S18 acetylase RimI-like enzyme